MLGFVKRIWRAAPIATVVLALSLAVAGYFAVQTAASWVYWSDPRHQNQQVQPWMTPGYVAHSWGIPREVMREALALDEAHGRGRPLARMAEERGLSVEQLIDDLEATIAAYLATQETGQ